MAPPIAPPPRMIRRSTTVRRAYQMPRAPDLVYPRPHELKLPRPAEKVTKAELKLLVEAFRNQPGVNVRPPSHQAPPIRSRPLEAVGIVDGNVAATVTLVRFVCPARTAGVITGIGFAFPPGAGATTWFQGAGNSARLMVAGQQVLPSDEGLTVSAVAGITGFTSLLPHFTRRSGTASTVTAGAGTGPMPGATAWQGAPSDQDMIGLMVPFFSREIIELVVVTTTVAGAEFIISGRVKGWFYPQRATTGDRGILGTLVD